MIMGVHNYADYRVLSAALLSILNQTFNDFEFIICDDGSTDDTYDKLRKICDSDSRIRLIRNKTNKGLAASLNRCLELATGDYIARMDSDDISTLDRLEKEVVFLDNNKKYDWTGTNAFLINDNGIWGERVMIEIPKKKDLLFTSPFIHPSVMIRREVILSVGGYRVSRETTRAEDYDLWLRLYAQGYQGYNIQDCLYKFREDNNAFHRRAYRYRIQEAIVRYKGFSQIGMLLEGLPYVVKPLIVGLIPQRILTKLRRDQIIYRK